MIAFADLSFGGLHCVAFSVVWSSASLANFAKPSVHSPEPTAPAVERFRWTAIAIAEPRMRK
jgi:hypothetical protein